MSQLFYPADQVDAILADLLAGVEAAVETAKSATAAREDLDKKLADTRIELQKVASAGPQAPVLDPGLVDQAVQALVDCSYLNPDSHKKLASELMADPNRALRLVTHVIQLSASSPEQGQGLSKPAARRGTDDDFHLDGWDAVITQGAA